MSCGSSSLKKLHISDREGVGICYSQCLACKLVFASRYMTDECLQDFYVSEYSKLYRHHVLSDKKQSKLVRRIIGISEQWGLTSILDYGCGDASLLGELKPWFDSLLGVEFGHSYTTNCGIDIVSPEVFFSSTGQKFDLILLSQVLEHLSDPRELLGRLVRCLSDVGVIVIEVPGIYSWSNILSNKRFLGQFKLCHKTYFSGESLMALATPLNLRVLHYDDSARICLTRSKEVKGAPTDMGGWLADPLIKNTTLSISQRMLLLTRLLYRKAWSYLERRILYSNGPR